MKIEKEYSILDIIAYSTWVMDYVDISESIDTYFWSKFFEANTALNKVEKKENEGSLDINILSDNVYLEFLKESDRYIYITLYNTSNLYQFPFIHPTDNYYWATWFHNFRTNTIEQIDFAIEKIGNCLEWLKKKNAETDGWMLEWVQKNEKHLASLIEKKRILKNSA